MVDKFEQNLDVHLSKLRACQENKGVDSCLHCEMVIKCETRKEYVDSVYSSMNKGNAGFFNFETE